MVSIPVIDLAEPNGAALDDACANAGLFYLAGHGLEDAALERLRALSHDFFDRPEADKRAVSQPSADRIRGYIGLGQAALAHSRGEESPPDVKESFNMGPPDPSATGDDNPPVHAPDHHAPNVWPERPAEFRLAWEDCYRRMEALASALLEQMAAALKLDRDFFLARSQGHVSVLGAIHYPPQEGPLAAGQLRSGAHTDFGSLTILDLDDAPGGLQAWSDQSGWCDVPARPGALVINLGDCMRCWSNGRWISPLHRVINPPAGAGRKAARLSLGFFHHPSPRAVIEPVPTCVDAARPAAFRPVLFGDHLRRQFTRQQQGT